MELICIRINIYVSRYTVVKLFEPFGKITQLDYLFHKSGPKRGQPRGYCFLEYSRKEVFYFTIYPPFTVINPSIHIFTYLCYITLICLFEFISSRKH